MTSSWVWSIALVGGGALQLGERACAQSNVRPGTDIALGILGDVSTQGFGRTGSFPSGCSSLAMATTACNLGSVNVPWFAPMRNDHPFISFLIGRETDGRLLQISNRSFAKHGFYALSNGQCTPCVQPDFSGTHLGVGCSDTYGVANNGDTSWLGPADEIDPWLGTWYPLCSYMDRGDPPVAPPQDCDLVPSPVSAGPLGNRVQVQDAEFNVTASKFYYQAQYTVRGEPVEVRDNNLGSREFVPSWSGTRWQLTVPASGNDLLQGSILQRWSGASVTSTDNGQDDGLLYLAVKTVDLGTGFYRYEYAIHNRDNQRGIDAFRIPICPGAQVQNVGFHDLDDDAGNDWQVTLKAAELEYSSTDNPLLWNSFYNFWFDCDAPPATARRLLLDAAQGGPGHDTLALDSSAPLGPLTATDLGHGLAGGNGRAPQFRACGDLGSTGVGSFLLRDAPPWTTAFLVGSFTQNPTPLFGGTLVPVPVQSIILLATDSQGTLTWSTAGGGGPIDVYMQVALADAAAAQGWTFSNALKVHLQP